MALFSPSYHLAAGAALRSGGGGSSHEWGAARARVRSPYSSGRTRFRGGSERRAREREGPSPELGEGFFGFFPTPGGGEREEAPGFVEVFGDALSVLVVACETVWSRR